MLTTPDLKGTVDFYVQTLEFACNAFQAEWSWASLQFDKLEIMFAVPNEHIPFDKPTFTGSFYFQTDDVDQLWERLKEKTKVCYPIEPFEYGMREFAIYDNNGYLLQFGQEINEANN